MRQYTLDYQDRYALRPTDPKKVKARYACPVCSIHVWGKPGLRLRCEVCDEGLRRKRRSGVRLGARKREKPHKPRTRHGIRGSM